MMSVEKGYVGGYDERRDGTYEDTRNKIAKAREEQLARAVAALRQIKTVCDDNASVADWGKAMALDFVRQVATSALD